MATSVFQKSFIWAVVSFFYRVFIPIGIFSSCIIIDVVCTMLWTCSVSDVRGIHGPDFSRETWESFLYLEFIIVIFVWFLPFIVFGRTCNFELNICSSKNIIGYPCLTMGVCGFTPGCVPRWNLRRDVILLFSSRVNRNSNQTC